MQTMVSVYRFVGGARVLIAMMVICLAGMTAGCSQYEDVSHQPVAKNFADITGQWRTKVKLRLIKSPRRSVMFVLPNDAFNDGGTKIVTVLPEQTKFNVRRYLMNETYTHTEYFIEAIIESGEYAGTICYLHDSIFRGRDPVTNKRYGTGKSNHASDFAGDPEILER